MLNPWKEFLKEDVARNIQLMDGDAND